MSKYVPKEFAPVIYPAWLAIFKTLSTEDRSEILLAIADYPNYEPQGVALWAFFKGELDRQYQKFLDRKEKASESGKKRWDTEGSERYPTLPNASDGNPRVAKDSLKPKPKPITYLKEVEEQKIDSMHSEPSAEQKKKRSAMTHRLSLQTIPPEWESYCKQVRPDLNPEVEFKNFVFYFTQGKGASKIRSDKGWSQAWQGWVRRAKESPNAQAEDDRSQWKLTPKHDWRAEMKDEKDNPLDHIEAINAYFRGAS